MGWLSQKVSQYFESACYGASLLLPETRQANQTFLITVFDAIQKEKHITSADIDHLETLMQLSDQIILPKWHDIKSLLEAESYLIKRLPNFSKKSIRFCLEYLYHLLSRHGRIGSETKAPIWFSIWRLKHCFPEWEQPIISDFIGWMRKNQFSPASILDRVRELHIFKRWLEVQEIASVEHITKDRALQYLYERSHSCQVSTCQKIGVQLQAFFEFYRERVDGCFPALSLSHFRPATGHGMNANSKEIQHLWIALKNGTLQEEEAIMLIFVLGLGLPLKVLPLLKLTEQPG